MVEEFNLVPSGLLTPRNSCNHYRIISLTYTYIVAVFESIWKYNVQKIQKFH